MGTPHDILDRIRELEIEQVSERLPRHGRILEIGAGTGLQASRLRTMGFDVLPIDLPTSNYAARRIVDVLDYDGRTLPVADGSMTAVFSSNVLEHVPDLPRMHAEIRRVLAQGGRCVHVLPTPAWRTWTTLTSYAAAVRAAIPLLPTLYPRRATRAELCRVVNAWNTLARRCGRLCLPVRHGERGNTLTETWYFSAWWWRRNFVRNGFVVEHDYPLGVFYSGYALLGGRLSIATRQWLSHVLGSTCRIYVLRPGAKSPGGGRPAP
jgi:SAM-dependent methyltransferase